MPQRAHDAYSIACVLSLEDAHSSIRRSYPDAGKESTIEFEVVYRVYATGQERCDHLPLPARRASRRL